MKTMLMGAALLLALPALANAQGINGPDDIIRALRPTANGPSRGIRSAPAPVMQPSAPVTRVATPHAAYHRPAQPPAPALSAAEPTQSGDVGALNMQVTFAISSDKLTPAAMHTLDAVGKALADQRLSGLNFRIEGHTDTVGGPAVNEALSLRRANTVVEFIASHYGIDRSRLTPVGLGETQLMVPTGNGVSEARNRRVVVVSTGS